MKIFLALLTTWLLSGCINVYECEGDHKETYNNISPTTQAATPDKDANKDTSKDTDKDNSTQTKTNSQSNSTGS